jgi:coiled-coil domain-containing protein 12
MSLAEASEARKARLIALRKRKAGEALDENGCVPNSHISPNTQYPHRITQPLIKNRNFDPESRTLKKHTQEDVEMEDTVEVQVKGLAEQIIADDEKRRAQELVRFAKFPLLEFPKADEDKKGRL